MSIVDVRPTVEAPDDDPYLWLEERESPQALAWVEAQNSATMKRFFDSRFAADSDALKLIFDRPRTTFRFLTGAAKSCLILGRMLNIRVDCGGRHRSTAFEVRTRNGMFLSILTHSQPRKAKIGYGAADCRCRERMTGPSFTYHVEVRTRLSYANSIS